MKTKLLGDAPRAFILVLETGDEAVSVIEEWANDEGVTAAGITAIGAFEASVLGFFEWESKEYLRIPVNQQAEVVSLIGDIALAEDRPKLHAHVVLGCRDGSARAGHLMSGYVRPTLEVVLTEAPAHLRRRTDPRTGLPLIEL
jgi:uncharacterized protein